MNRRPSSTFVRLFRKQFLEKDGTPKAGCEASASILLEVLSLTQEGKFETAAKVAYEVGLDLDFEYKKYLEAVAARKSKS